MSTSRHSFPTTLFTLTAATWIALACDLPEGDDPMGEDAVELEMDLADADLSAQDVEELGEGRSEITGNPRPTSANCSGTGCDGRDPVDYGCAADAVTLGSPVKIGWLWPIYLDQRCSSKCKTRWSRMYTNSNATFESKVTIRRGTDGGEKYPYTHNGTLNYTDMVYCPRNTCKANAYGYVFGDKYETGYMF